VLGGAGCFRTAGWCSMGPAGKDWRRVSNRQGGGPRNGWRRQRRASALAAHTVQRGGQGWANPAGNPPDWLRQMVLRGCPPILGWRRLHWTDGRWGDGPCWAVSLRSISQLVLVLVPTGFPFARTLPYNLSGSRHAEGTDRSPEPPLPLLSWAPGAGRPTHRGLDASGILVEGGCERWSA